MSMAQFPLIIKTNEPPYYRFRGRFWLAIFVFHGLLEDYGISCYNKAVFTCPERRLTHALD
jgi:hypothetical protein